MGDARMPAEDLCFSEPSAAPAAPRSMNHDRPINPCAHGLKRPPGTSLLGYDGKKDTPRAIHQAVSKS
jgi:hypothetical protein